MKIFTLLIGFLCSTNVTFLSRTIGLSRLRGAFFVNLMGENAPNFSGKLPTGLPHSPLGRFAIAIQNLKKLRLGDDSMGGSFEELIARSNREGFSGELLTGHTDLADPRQVAHLMAMLEDPEFQTAVRNAAVHHAAQELLNGSDSGRALLSEDWADPGLCGYSWLSWLPWMDCTGVDAPKEINYLSPGIYQQGDCYHSP